MSRSGARALAEAAVNLLEAQLHKVRFNGYNLTVETISLTNCQPDLMPTSIICFSSDNCTASRLRIAGKLLEWNTGS